MQVWFEDSKPDWLNNQGLIKIEHLPGLFLINLNIYYRNLNLKVICVISERSIVAEIVVVLVHLAPKLKLFTKTTIKLTLIPCFFFFININSSCCCKCKYELHNESLIKMLPDVCCEQTI